MPAAAFAPGICAAAGLEDTLLTPGAGGGCDGTDEVVPPDTGAGAPEVAGEPAVAGLLLTVIGGLLTVTGGATPAGGLTETVAEADPLLSPADPDADTTGEPVLTVTPVEALETLAVVLTDVLVVGPDAVALTEVPPGVDPDAAVTDVVPAPAAVLTRALVLTAGTEPVVGLVDDAETAAVTLTGTVALDVVPVPAAAGEVDEDVVAPTAPLTGDVVLETALVTGAVEIPVSARAPSIPTERAPAAARKRAAEMVPINRNSCASMIGARSPRAGEVPHALQFSCHTRGPDRAVH